MDTTMMIVIFAVVLVVAVVATWFIAVSYRKNIAEAKVGKAEDKARQIIDDALKSAEAKKRETLLEAKEEAMKTKNEIEKEVKDRRNEVQRMEKRILSREENLDRKSEAMRMLNEYENISDILRFHGLLCSQLEIMVEARENPNIAGINPYRLKKAIEASSKLSTARLKAALSACYKIENEIKSGRIDARLSLELFIAKI